MKSYQYHLTRKAEFYIQLCKHLIDDEAAHDPRLDDTDGPWQTKEGRGQWGVFLGFCMPYFGFLGFWVFGCGPCVPRLKLNLNLVVRCVWDFYFYMFFLLIRSHQEASEESSRRTKTEDSTIQGRNFQNKSILFSSGEHTPVEEPGPAPFWQLLSAGPFTSGWLCVFMGPGHHELNFLRNSRWFLFDTNLEHFF